MTHTTSTMFKTPHEKAVEFKPNGLRAPVFEDCNNSMMGIVKKLPKDEATLNAPVEEMNEPNKTRILRLPDSSCHMIIATVNAIMADKILLAKLTMSLFIH